LSSSIYDGVRLHPGAFGEFNRPVADAFNCHVNGTALIALLRRPISPPAITRPVVRVIVDAVKGVTMGTVAHVIGEGLIAVSPPLAHLNAPPAVVGERLGPGV
jgi:hypothetical protein